MNDECSHGSYIRQVTPSSPNRCLECVAAGDRWVHLRICLTCGHVGCCNDSKNRHAEAHFHATGHPIIQSFAVVYTANHYVVDLIIGGLYAAAAVFGVRRLWRRLGWPE